MREHTLDKLRFSRSFSSFREEMETSTVSYYVWLFYIITSKYCSVLTGNLSNDFKLESTFCNYTCPAEGKIFHENKVQSKAVCTLLCINTRPCFGVFFHPGTKECIGCNSATAMLPLDGALFYKQGNSYFYRLIFSDANLEAFSNI